jgi:hypothetical protein
MAVLLPVALLLSACQTGGRNVQQESSDQIISWYRFTEPVSVQPAMVTAEPTRDQNIIEFMIMDPPAEWVQLATDSPGATAKPVSETDRLIFAEYIRSGKARVARFPRITSSLAENISLEVEFPEPVSVPDQRIIGMRGVRIDMEPYASGRRLVPAFQIKVNSLLKDNGEDTQFSHFVEMTPGVYILMEPIWWQSEGGLASQKLLVIRFQSGK